MKKNSIIILGVVLVGVLIAFILYAEDNIGISSSKLETDVRKSQRIADDWTVDGCVSNEMAAFISYPDSKSEHSFSIYVKHQGLSYGYFFRFGGSLSDVERGIIEFTAKENKERAFISMNMPHVSCVEIDDGDSVQVIDIDSEKPFVIILPINAGNITFYDVDRNPVDYLESPI